MDEDLEEGGTPTPPVTGRPRIAALVLAGGQSRRMGEINKLLAPIDGIAMIRRVVDNVAESSVVSTTVVLGHEAGRLREVLAGAEVEYVENPDFGGGLSTSLKAGMSVVPEGADGVIICLGDMPMVDASTLDRMIAAFDPVEGRAIVVPTRRGKRGNPVLFARRFFEEMTNVSGDVGARHLIGKHEDVAVEIEIDDDSVLMDVDTPEALAKLTAGSS